MAFKTALTEMFGIDHPVILAPMALVSGGRLAAAVSSAGGLGLIGGGYGDPDWVAREYDEAGNAPVGIGFITWTLTRELLTQVLARRPVAVMLSFGDPAPFADAIRDAGAKLICQVQTVAGAHAARDAGADLVIAQGTEAGGHGGDRATLALTPAVIDAVAPVPVAAAGGIADGRGLAAALALGACGALIGTRFFAAAESVGHDNARQRIVEATGDGTRRTTVFDIVRRRDWPGRFAGRALENDFMDRWHGREAELAGALDSEEPRYATAARDGDFDTGVVFAGEAVDLIDSILPAGEIVERIVAEARDILSRLGAEMS